MKASKAFVWGCCLAGIFNVAALGAETAFMPAGASAVHWIDGNEIILEGGGQKVFLEIYVGNWDPDLDGSPKLRAWQAKIDSTGYSSALRGTLTPWNPACATDGDCEALMGSLGHPWGTAKGGCGAIGWPDGECIPAWIDNSRTDYVFAELGEQSAVDVSTLDYRYGSTLTSSPIADPGTPRYAGTLALDVPLGAMGTFTVGFQSEGTNMQDENGVYITPLTLAPALITIACETNSDCDDGSLCTMDSCEQISPDYKTCSNVNNYDDAVYCCNPADGTLTEIDDQNDCTDDQCHPEDGSVTHEFLPNGTDCDDGDACNIGETCQSGLCTGGSPPDCSRAGDECNTAHCDPLGEEGNCDILTPVEDGTDCDDADACNVGEACYGGACAGGSPPDCSGFGDQCNTASCDPFGDDGNCNIVTQKPEETPCDDEDRCNVGETCQVGVCTGGSPPDCSGAGDQCNTASCDPGGAEGNCDTLTPLLEGTPCDDGDPCTGTGRPGIGFDACDGEGDCFGVWDPECNDDCEFAIEVHEGTSTGNNHNRGPDDAEASCQLDSNNDVWFVYTPICNGTIFVSTTGSQFTPSNDPVLSVWDACPDDGGSEIACDDDSGVDLHSALTFTAAPGATYWIRVAGFEDNTGDIALNISTVDGCLIDGACYPADTVNPENECQACIPEVSTSTWSPKLEGAPCGNPIDTDCDSPDACDGAGVCESNPKPDGTECSDDGIECTFDVCEAGSCTHPPKPAGTACGDDTNTQCDDPDTCDGAGGCLDNHEPDGTTCDDEDPCTGNDVCNTGHCVGTPPLAPIVEAQGGRQVFVTAQSNGAPDPVALLLTSPDWPCLSKYIDANGQLVTGPVFQMPSDWDTVIVKGVDIVPSSTYNVATECGAHLSAPGSDTTWVWGDVAGRFIGGAWMPGDGLVDIYDFMAIKEGFQHLDTAPPVEWTDLHPCVPGPDGVINISDITYVMDAFRGFLYPCPVPCP